MDIKLKEINSYEKEIMINLNWNEIEKDFEKAQTQFSQVESLSASTEKFKAKQQLNRARARLQATKNAD